MGEDTIRRAGRALEDAFWAKRDREKLEALREQLAKEAKTAELAAATGIDSPEVLEQLHALDIGPDTLSALVIVPLIEIAWADGKLDERERDAILKAAIQEGVDPDGPTHGLLETWLASRPGPELRAAWFEYVRAFCARLSPDARAEFQRTLLENAFSVAEATGGFLGLGSRTSPAEQQVIEDLRSAFAED